MLYFRRIGCVLGLLGVLSLGSCPSPNRNVDTGNKKGNDDADTVAAQQTAVIGKYQCRWLRGEKGLDLPCEIRKKGGDIVISMIAGEASLSGTITTTAFGFRFSGDYTASKGAAAEKLAADFFNQGAGTYASVLTLADKSLVKLDLHRE